jgi:hypothetical protein
MCSKCVAKTLLNPINRLFKWPRQGQNPRISLKSKLAIKPQNTALNEFFYS